MKSQQEICKIATLGGLFQCGARSIFQKKNRKDFRWSQGDLSDQESDAETTGMSGNSSFVTGVLVYRSALEMGREVWGLSANKDEKILSTFDEYLQIPDSMLGCSYYVPSFMGWKFSMHLPIQPNRGDILVEFVRELSNKAVFISKSYS